MDQQTFKKWDDNNNGQLSKQGFMRGAKKAQWMNRWDDNNRINRNEFNQAGFNGNFGNWDQNSSGNLERNEFYTGIYTMYDQNDNGHWNWGEWDDAGDNGSSDASREL